MRKRDNRRSSNNSNNNNNNEKVVAGCVMLSIVAVVPKMNLTGSVCTGREDRR
jgi:hypothetical protein